MNSCICFPSRRKSPTCYTDSASNSSVDVAASARSAAAETLVAVFSVSTARTQELTNASSYGYEKSPLIFYASLAEKQNLEGLWELWNVLFNSPSG